MIEVDETMPGDDGAIGNHRPPRSLAPASRSAFLKALLHCVRQPPPPLCVGIGGDTLHISLIVASDVLVMGDKQVQWGVIMYGIFRDVMLQ